MTPSALAAGGYRSAKKLLHRMTDDLTPEEFRAQPVPGANSAAWVVGHLAATLHRSATRLGATDLPPLPPGAAEKFAVTKQSAGVQADLGDPAEFLRLFDAYIDRVAELVERLPAEELEKPPPVPMPIVDDYGGALVFGALHVAVHSGQLSTIRRSLGKPPVV